MVQLTTVHRQQSEDRFAKVLEELATKKLSSADYQLVSSKNYSVVGNEEIHNLKKTRFTCVQRRLLLSNVMESIYDQHELQ